MRKLTFFVMVLLVLMSFSAFAQMGQGRGMGRGVNTASATVTNVDEAKSAVLNEASKRLGSNVSVVSATEGQGRRGKNYIVTVKDSKGTVYEYHVNPWGEVILFK